MELSRLEEINLREIWKNEASDFTTWLAMSENLEFLADEIGIDISLIQTEAPVGQFKVDILAEEEHTGRKVVIENQLESTDHDHLGKVITYASGVGAEFIIWIVKSAQDEHKQAVDWLNEHIDSTINFFIIEMEVWKIKDSPPAPRFNLVAKPNNWAKAVKASNDQGELSATRLLQFEFWTKFMEYAKDRTDQLQYTNPYAGNWYVLRFGSSKAQIELRVSIQKKEEGLSCLIYMKEKSKEQFHKFYENKEKIETALSLELDWQEMPDNEASKILISRDGDISEKDNWDEYFRWLLEKASSFQEVFSKYIQ